MIGLTNAGAMRMVRQNGDFFQTRMHASNKNGNNNGKLLLMSYIATNLLPLDEKNGNRKMNQASIRQLSQEMCDSLLETARKQRPIKARADYMKLKEQRDEKKGKRI